MNSDDPDLEAFKSNICRILGERKFDKAAALVSNLCPNASDPQSIGVSSKDNARRESPCGTSSQSDSEDLPDDHETSSEWKFERHSGISKINGTEQGGFARDNWRRRLSKIIE